jgi:hypothetical protein
MAQQVVKEIKKGTKKTPSTSIMARNLPAGLSR